MAISSDTYNISQRPYGLYTLRFGIRWVDRGYGAKPGLPAQQGDTPFTVIRPL
jgi:hypothetical protein